MTETEPAVGVSRKTMLLGDTTFEVVEPVLIEPRYADVYTELRVVDGVVLISLGATTADYGNGPPEIRVVTRLRIPLSTLSNIQGGVERILSQLAQAKQSAN